MAARYQKKPGYTELIHEAGVSKADDRLRVVGAIDEANASLGFAKALLADQAKRDLISSCQQILSLIMAVIAGWKNKNTPQELEAALSRLEQELAQLKAEFPPPNEFILPGETPVSAALDVARAVVRRAEREAVWLAQHGGNVSDTILTYLNRLSSVCFSLEIAELSKPQAG
jgi:cob(I)alamin adenosyltransferase